MREFVYALGLVIIILVLAFSCIGCVYHREIQLHDGRMEKIHIGFPEFSDGKEINLIKVN
tara:strand:+ start:2501 stop:2680 length:180 start_codon:yes stop_codon:yes gene_type:complete